MNAMTHQVAIKWLELAGQLAPLWLFALQEGDCCSCVEPGEQCDHKANCSQREHCRAVEACPTVTFSAMHCGSALLRAAAQHVVDGAVAVIRTDTFITSEVRQ